MDRGAWQAGLESIGSQRVRHYGVTEKDKEKKRKSFFKETYCHLIGLGSISLQVLDL